MVVVVPYRVVCFYLFVEVSLTGSRNQKVIIRRKYPPPAEETAAHTGMHNARVAGVTFNPSLK